MITLPTDEEIQQLHEKYAPSREAYDLVFTHCQIVWEIADQLIARREPPMIHVGLVKAGCLLHDLGVYRLYDAKGLIDHKNYIKHGILGYELLKSEGFSEDICRFASCHTGVGLTRDDIHVQKLPLPVADYLAETPEERLLMYADKFHSKTDPPRFMSFGAYSDYVKRFGEDKVTKFKMLAEEFGEPDLAPFAEDYGYFLQLRAS
jgi:uncharacterized protein